MKRKGGRERRKRQLLDSTAAATTTIGPRISVADFLLDEGKRRCRLVLALGARGSSRAIQMRSIRTQQ